MGAEVVKCCTQTLTDENDRSSILLQESAKHLSNLSEELPPATSTPSSPIINNLTDIPSESLSNSKRSKSALERYKKNTCRRQAQLSLEEELEATEIQLQLEKQAIKLLRKQNEYLRQQNEKFLLQYGSHFAVTTNSNPTTANSSNSSIRKHTHSLSLTSTISNTSQISYSNQSNDTTTNKPHSPFSPLTPLTNKQTKIILSYSMNDETNGFPDVVPQMARSCSVPVFNEHVHD